MAQSQDTSQMYWNSTPLVLGEAMILCFSGSPGLGYLTMDNEPFLRLLLLVWNSLPSKLRTCSSVDVFVFIYCICLF